MENLTGEALCRALMRDMCEFIYNEARRQVGYLRHGAKTIIEKDMGKHMLALAPLQFTEQQLDALEAAFRETQEDLIGALFSLIDGSAQPPGWPDEIRLVDMDTGQTLCPGQLEWEFGMAMGEYRAQHTNGG